MSYNDVFINIFSLVSADTTLVPSILGAVTTQNLRLYRVWPQFQSMLTTYEPNQPSEGWLVIEAPMPGIQPSHEQFTSDHEWMEIDFHVYGTTYAVTHDAMDRLDTIFHWTVAQQRDLGLWGERYLLFTRRVHNLDKYAPEYKIFQKDFKYRMEFVRAVQLQP